MDTRNITTIHWCPQSGCKSGDFALCLGKRLGYIAALRTNDPLPEVFGLLSELLCLHIPISKEMRHEVMLNMLNVRIDSVTLKHLVFWLRAEDGYLSVGCTSAK